MPKCKTCKYFKKCVIDCGCRSEDPSCSSYAQTSFNTPPKNKKTITVPEDVRVVCNSKTRNSSSSGTSSSILEEYFKDIISAFKEPVHDNIIVQDKTIIEKITYIIRNLGHIIGKPEPEDIFREELFINLIHEDFEINQALDHAISKIENSIKSRGIEVGFDSAKIYKIADIVTEIRMIYKLILACGLSGYANEIMSHVIAAKFTLRQTQVLKDKK